MRGFVHGFWGLLVRDLRLALRRRADASLTVLFFGGIGMSGFATMQSAIMIYVSSPEMRGRALGAVAVFIGIGPFGQLGIGLLANILDPATAVLITASVGIVGMAIAFFVYPMMSGSRALDQAPN